MGLIDSGSSRSAPETSHRVFGGSALDSPYPSGSRGRSRPRNRGAIRWAATEPLPSYPRAQAWERHLGNFLLVKQKGTPVGVPFARFNPAGLNPMMTI